MGYPGIIGIWSDEHKLIEACDHLRKAGFTKFDSITPCPVHGFEEAIGIKRSFVPWITFFAGAFGCGAGLYLQYWTSAVSWPINIGGKPMFSLPAFIPVTFEMTILFAALCSVAGMLYFCRLPIFNPPVIKDELTSHKFAIYVPEDDTGFNEEKVKSLLSQLGAEETMKAEY